MNDMATMCADHLREEERLLAAALPIVRAERSNAVARRVQEAAILHNDLAGRKHVEAADMTGIGRDRRHGKLKARQTQTAGRIQDRASVGVLAFHVGIRSLLLVFRQLDACANVADQANVLRQRFFQPFAVRPLVENFDALPRLEHVERVLDAFVVPLAVL